MKNDSFYVAWDPVDGDPGYEVYVNGETYYYGLHGSVSSVPIACEAGKEYTVSVAYYTATGLSKSSAPLKVSVPAASSSDAPTEPSEPSELPPEEDAFPLWLWGIIVVGGFGILTTLVLLLRRRRK